MSNESDSAWITDDTDHPSMDLLVAHHERRLEADEADALAEHLSRCSHCTQMVLDLAAFPRVGSSDSEALADEPTLDEAWADFSRALPEHEATASSSTPSSSTRWGQRVAASLAWLVLGFAAGSYWNPSRDGAGLAQRAELNVPIVDLFPTTFARGADDVPVIPTETESFVVILNPSNPDAFPAYDLDIVDREDRLVWQAAAIPTNRYGGFNLNLSRQLLTPGTYRIQLFASGATPRQALEVFRFEVPAPAPPD